MMKRKRQSRMAAFSLIELIVIVAVIALLAFVLLPSMANAKKAREVECINNLRQVALAFRLWGNGDRFAMAVSTNQGGSQEVSGDVWRTFLVLSNELGTPNLLACPSDGRPPAASWTALGNSNISYFICLDADETMPNMFLSGDRNLTNASPPSNHVITVTGQDVLGWTGALHGGSGNLALSDGSVRRYDKAMLHPSVTNALYDAYGAAPHPTSFRLAFP